MREMTAMTGKLQRAYVLPLLVLLIFLGCSDVMGTDVQTRPDDLPELTPGIHPVLVVAEGEGTAILEVHLKRVDVDARVASYQGEIRYDATSLPLESGSIPQGITGMWNEVAAGHVRFAGVALEGLEESAVLTLAFSTTAERLEASDFALQIEELIANQGFEDLTSQIQHRPSPHMTRTPLR